MSTSEVLRLATSLNGLRTSTLLRALGPYHRTGDVEATEGVPLSCRVRPDALSSPL